MAAITLPGGIRVALEYEHLGKIVVNVYNVTTPDPINSIVLLDIRNVFETWWRDHLAAIFSEQLTLVNVAAKDISVLNGGISEGLTSPPKPGGSLEASTPSQVAWCATLKTAKTGRSFLGRSYHTGLAETAVTDNNVGAGKVGTLQAAYAALQTDLAIANATLVVASYISGGVPRVTGVATPVNSIIVKTRVDTQRRRLPAE